VGGASACGWRGQARGAFGGGGLAGGESGLARQGSGGRGFLMQVVRVRWEVLLDAGSGSQGSSASARRGSGCRCVMRWGSGGRWSGFRQCGSGWRCVRCRYRGQVVTRLQVVGVWREVLWNARGGGQAGRASACGGGVRQGVHWAVGVWREVNLNMRGGRGLVGGASGRKGRS
jgi:hypothetical protein